MRLRDWSELVRLPNVLTAPPDVAMGLAVSGATMEPKALLLLFASALAYAGGMALNDVCDADRDRHERPKRPIPSGRIPVTSARIFAISLLLASCVLSAIVGIPSAITALALAAAIVVYDVYAKSTAWAPPVMAACRGLNVGLGISLGVATFPSVLSAILIFVYVAVLTYISRFEVKKAPLAAVQKAVAWFGILVVCVAAFVWKVWPNGAPLAMIFLTLFSLWLTIPCKAALQHPAPLQIIGIVRACVLGLPLLDATLVAASSGVLLGATVALAFVPAFALGKWFASA